MRTIRLIALTIISFLSIGIYAQKKVEVTLKERQPQERESLIYKNNEITSKIVYEYDCNGYRTKRTSYEWNKTLGWVALSLYQFEYNTNDQIDSVYYTKWDIRKEKWTDISDLITYKYDSDGNLAAIERTKISGKPLELVSLY
ncbi:MAG: hypothetical protein KH100_00185 [Dysgonomonas mossii]|uniref:hypothetical protein n=1 Tax=Dysgonomonas mossii TaxID=163665 RepID=UPI001DB8C683|nr:hypothetical protein [Dysgonomonas mossii]MBS5797692.1 hypothetical protein [Dysgonomonas mossii]MBS7109605.1 hypothetical protein [Dysgonomonas mossii]